MPRPPQRDSLREALHRGPVLGSFVSLGHPASVEILASRGFQTLCIDAEHAALGPAEVESLIRAADAAGVPSLVRVSGVGAEINRALDSGACGVVVPRVETASQAAAAVAAVRYPPAGSRGAGPGRASAYGMSLAGYIASANDETLLIVQVETQLGLDNVAEIAAVDGIDVLFVGPGDLAVSLGEPGGSAAHSAAVEKIVDAARAAGVRSGIFCLDSEQVERWASAGVHLFLLGGDLLFLGSTASTAFDAAAEKLASIAAAR
ncbi:4-hydroxy-2-oxovalerate aldolase [Acrocarpospora pleiomorpha]|uniref:4-hydroxy-2-oxovalerate aldolase n=1 Tax=Acrocarpospora pleiomorpha TaxID=90975 RepID=A0A5M3XJM9_9ACTN|nr:aldolase/citrate lyase family protein [Acrocarpospora pleiomorpha]GES19323.1 4-hydroxy-2-oxovalerate aldolase [Acrocarpospora pleiomorpha]